MSRSDHANPDVNPSALDHANQRDLPPKPPRLSRVPRQIQKIFVSRSPGGFTYLLLKSLSPFFSGKESEVSRVQLAGVDGAHTPALLWL